MLGPGHHDGVALAHGLLVEGQARRVVGHRIHALLGEGGNLGGGLDVDPGHLVLVDPVELGEGGKHLALPVAGRGAHGLALEVLGLGDGRFLAAPDIERGLVEDHTDHLDLAATAHRRDDHGAVGQADVRATRVHLRDRVARALGVLELDVEPFGLVVALLEGDPVGGVIADGKPVEREDDLLGRLRRSRQNQGEQRHREEEDGGEKAHHGVSPCQSEISAQGAIQRAARTTAPYTARPTAEIQTRAAKATGVFMLPCVVMMT